MLVGIDCLSAIVDHIQVPFIHDLVQCGTAFRYICLEKNLITVFINLMDLPDEILSVRVEEEVITHIALRNCEDNILSVRSLYVTCIFERNVFEFLKMRRRINSCRSHTPCSREERV